MPVANLPLVPSNRDQDGGVHQILADCSKPLVFHELNIQSFYLLSIWSCMQKGSKSKISWMFLRPLKYVITWGWVPEWRSCWEQSLTS